MTKKTNRKRIANAFNIQLSELSAWEGDGCPVDDGLPAVVAWRVKTLIEENAAHNHAEEIRANMRDVMLNSDSGVAKVQAAKLLRDIDAASEDPSQRMPKAVAFIEIENIDGVIQATGEVDVICPQCKASCRFSPV